MRSKHFVSYVIIELMIKSRHRWSKTGGCGLNTVIFFEIPTAFGISKFFNRIMDFSALALGCMCCN